MKINLSSYNLNTVTVNFAAVNPKELIRIATSVVFMKE